MTNEYILSKVDHTLLTQNATWQEIKALCDDAVKYKTASVCVPPSFVSRCSQYLSGKGVCVCTVIGFPNGYQTMGTKVFEAKDAVENGADEIDMVINIGDVKMGEYEKIQSEICKVRECTKGKILKVIIECCLLTDDEKKQMCRIVSNSGADYIKTSTGFSKGGATREDIILFSENISNGVKIKAAGGISSLEDAKDFLLLGASRLGTSKIVKLIKNESAKGDY